MTPSTLLMAPVGGFKGLQQFRPLTTNCITYNMSSIYNSEKAISYMFFFGTKVEFVSTHRFLDCSIENFAFESDADPSLFALQWHLCCETSLSRLTPATLQLSNEACSLLSLIWFLWLLLNCFPGALIIKFNFWLSTKRRHRALVRLIGITLDFVSLCPKVNMHGYTS